MSALADDSPEAVERSTDGSRETVAVGASWLDTVRAGDGGFPISVASVLDENCVDWLLDCQHRKPNPTTGAEPGGWAWTDLAGGVPETIDTASSLVALARWRHRYPQLKRHRLELAACRGIEWLVELQNTDGGWPTACRGWNVLAADRSACDVDGRRLACLGGLAKNLATRRPPRQAGFGSQ